jgi:hypothetical protein
MFILKFWNSKLKYEQHIRYLLSKTGREDARKFLMKFNICTLNSERILLTAALIYTHPHDIIEQNDSLGQDLIQVSKNLLDCESNFISNFGLFSLKFNEWKKQDKASTINGLLTALECCKVERDVYLNNNSNDSLDDVNACAEKIIDALRLLNIEASF